MSEFFNDDYGSGKGVIATGAAYVFIGLLLIFSAVTSMAFFFIYAPDTFSFISPRLSPYLAAFVGALVFEGGTLVWPMLKSKHADTKEQIGVAGVGGWGALAGGVLVTIAYFALNNTLISGQLDAGGYTAVSILGGILIVVGIAGNFVLAYLYINSSAKHKEAEHMAAQRAMAADARHTISTETAKATLNRTVGQIREQLPGQAAQQGQANASQFMDNYFTVRGNGNGRANGRPLSSDEPTPSWEQMIDFARRHPDLADQMAREARSRIGQNGHAAD